MTLISTGAVVALKQYMLISHMNVCSSPLPDPSDSLNDATDFAAKFRQNVVEDSEVYVKISCAVRHELGFLRWRVVNAATLGGIMPYCAFRSEQMHSLGHSQHWMHSTSGSSAVVTNFHMSA